MVLSNEIRAFIRALRARTAPDAAGITLSGGERKVEGLRREEVALLAGMSPDYYRRLERGNLQGVSDAVLESLAEALRLGPAERAHLWNLARSANFSSRSRSRDVDQPRLDPHVDQLLERITVPASIRNALYDVLSANAQGRALFPHLFESDATTGNHLRYIFMDPRSRAVWADWEASARAGIASLRMEFGRNPYDPKVLALIDELAEASEDFRRIWALQEVRFVQNGRKTIVHPHLGEIDLYFQALEVPTAASSLTIVTYSAVSGTRAERALEQIVSSLRPDSNGGIYAVGAPR